MATGDKGKGKKDDLKTFTVGSVQPVRASKGKAASAAKAVKLEFKEKDFPVLTSLKRSRDLKAFQKELQRVLAAVAEVSGKGSAKDKESAQSIQKAYALAAVVLEGGRIIR